jgi:hypothetical protein
LQGCKGRLATEVGLRDPSEGLRVGTFRASIQLRNQGAIRASGAFETNALSELSNVVGTLIARPFDPAKPSFCVVDRSVRVTRSTARRAIIRRGRSNNKLCVRFAWCCNRSKIATDHCARHDEYVAAIGRASSFIGPMPYDMSYVISIPP